jgi:ABC-type transport system involved in cytochrome bd biosynthesis fused ATPase/permease subunit
MLRVSRRSPLLDGRRWGTGLGVVGLLLVVLELATRLSMFGTIGAVLAPTETALPAVMAASLAAVAGMLRSLLRGERLRRCLLERWGSVLTGARARDVRDLAGPDGSDRVLDLVNATYDVAHVDAVVGPELLGIAASLLVVLAVTAARLGVAWVACAGLVGGLVGTALYPVRRALRRARMAAWDAQLRAGSALESLFEGAPELRAQGLEARFVATIRADVLTLATQEREAARRSAWLASAPAVVALVAPWIPREALHSLLGARAPEVVLLGAAGASLALGLLAALEAHARSTPLRERIDAFVSESVAGLSVAPPPDRLAAPSTHEFAHDELRLEVRSLSVRHPGASRPCPAPVSFSARRGGVALLGTNGTGKSTLLGAIAGLYPPASGAVLWRLGDDGLVDAAAIAPATTYLPQRPHVVPSKSVRWHVERFGVDALDESELVASLEALGVVDENDASPQRLLDQPMSALSGGYQQRVLLARSLAHGSAVVLLDEPEAGLDLAGRHRLRGLLEQLARTRVVIVAAHDTGVIPPEFMRIELHAPAARDLLDDA